MFYIGRLLRFFRGVETVAVDHEEFIVPSLETVGHRDISSLSGPTIPLSALDQIVPRVVTCICFCLPYDETNDKGRTISVLKEGLRQTITALPFLTADVMSTEKGWLELAPGNGVLFVVRDLTKPSAAWNESYTELDAKKMPLSELDCAILAPTARMHAAGGRTPVMAVQVNFIQGGLLLYLNCHHSVLDRAASSVILRAWAGNCRRRLMEDGAEGGSAANATSEEPEVTPESLAKRPLLEIPPSAKTHEHFAGRLQPKSNEQQVLGPGWLATNTLPPSRRRVIFHFSSASLGKLKADLSSDKSAIADGDLAQSWISTNDAVGALLWCCIDIARYTRYQSEGSSQFHQESTMGMAVNARARLDPPLPSTFLGNVLISSKTKRDMRTPTTSLLHAAAVAARDIRSSLTTINDKYIRSVVANINSLPNLSIIVTSVMSSFTDAVFMTSSANYELYDLDWGMAIGSKVAYVRLLDGRSEGIIMVNPRLPDKSLEVLVVLRDDDMEHLQDNEVLARYASFQCE